MNCQGWQDCFENRLNRKVWASIAPSSSRGFMGIGTFLHDTLNIARENDVHIRLSPNEHIISDGSKCGGYFTEYPYPLLICAMGKDQVRWLSILVHESCHMDQWIEQTPSWTDSILKDGSDLTEPFWPWLKGEEYSDDEVHIAIDLLLKVELDCEKRSIAKIKRYGLDLDMKEYIQKANTYVFLYLYMKDTRKWYPTIYDIEDIWTTAPTVFVHDYTKIPKKLHTAFRKHLK